jgi:hypothetical protein
MTHGCPARVLLVSLVLLSNACSSASSRLGAARDGSAPRGREGAVCGWGYGALFGGARHGLLALRGGGEAGREVKCVGCGKTLVLKKVVKEGANKGRGFYSCFAQVRSPIRSASNRI